MVVNTDVSVWHNFKELQTIEEAINNSKILHDSFNFF